MRPPRTSKRLCLLQPQPQPHSHFSDEPVPLCVLQPPVRRSPRLLSPPAPDASESRRLSLSAASSRTRSPRLDSPMQCNAESKSPLKKATRSSTGKTGSVVLSGGMALSRSPRFGASPGLDLSVLSVESKSALKKVVRCSPWKTGSVVLSGGMALRRSPRFGGSPMLDLSVQSVESKSALKKVTRCSPWKTGSVAFSSGMALRRSPRFCSSASDFGTRRTNVARIAAKGRGSADQSSMPNDGQGKLSKVMKYSKAKFCQKPSILSSGKSAPQTSSQKSSLFADLKSSHTNSFISLSPKCHDLKTKSLVEEKPVVPWHKEHEKAHMNATLDDSRDMEIVELTSSQRLKMTTEDSCCKESARKPSVAVADDKQLKDHARNAAILVDDEYVEVKSIYTDSPDKQPYKKNKPSPMNSDTSVFDDWCLNQCPTDDVLPLKPEDGGFLYTAQTLLDPIGKQTSVETEFSSSVKIRSKQKRATFFIGDPIPEDEARRMWQWRYDLKNQTLRSAKKLPESGDEDEIVMNVKSHYRQAEVGGCIFDVGDCAYIRGEGKQKHVGRILEFFRTTDDEDYFRVQWFYRAEDTVMQEQASFHDKRRLFYSTVQNDNPVKCILSKVTIARLKPKVSVKSAQSLQSNLYYDMEYSLEYSTFSSFISGDDSSHSIDGLPSLDMKNPSENIARCGIPEVELNLNLLDLYSGCGGMSTGLRLGAKLSGINLVTRWALDCDKSACESLKLNYPETEIRNEHAEDFLKLLKEWEKLCRQFPINGFACTNRLRSNDSRVTQSDESFVDVSEGPEGEYEVSNLVDICYGDPNETDKPGLYFKVHWKGYGSHEDTWEPIEGLRNCQERIQEFVRKGFKSKILPLPGDVDVICGGPPCQGISGYNRYRNVEAPLDDTRNRQIVVFMDIVQFLKPKFVLMENVTDILRLDKASLARYALSRLVHMRYQARLGTMAAGCYGLPQFRLRVFLWGAHPEERLPQFPLPTHDVIIRYWPPPEFERNVVGYDEDHTPDIEKHAVLQDAIFDLPSVPNRETREEIPYDKSPETDFQKYIRAAKHEFAGSPLNGCTKMTNSLYDHRPYSVSEDNYSRICQIPKKKGANFRDLPGVIVRADNSVQRDETKEQVLLPSGEPMVHFHADAYISNVSEVDKACKNVPDYVFTFEQGKSKKPFGRLWWDETVPTVLTFPNWRNQMALHPEQDRVLTIRECARLQGFPDYYRFSGTVKERYCQIGNAVAVSVSRALGYALGMAYRKQGGHGPNMVLPPKFSTSTYLELTKSSSVESDHHAN